jgi:hypothetical protein
MPVPLRPTAARLRRYRRTPQEDPKDTRPIQARMWEAALS